MSWNTSKLLSWVCFSPKLVVCSGVATGGARGQSATPDSEKIAKNREKRGKSGKIGEKAEKSGREGKNWEGFFFHFAPPEIGAGYA